MSFLSDILGGIGSSLHTVFFFIVAISALVSVHEFGHFWVARRCGVKVETFSIGFGRELFGWTDKTGTRWRVSALPLGGYVRFFGDADATSARGDDSPMTAEERRVSYQGQSVGKRAAIAAAGPVANFILAIFLFFALFFMVGQPFTAPVVDKVSPGSAAEAAGILPGDRFIEADGRSIESFEDLRLVIRLNQGTPIDIALDRGGARMDLTVTPGITEVDDGQGGKQKIGLLGVAPSGLEFRERGFFEALWYGTREVGSVIDVTTTAVGQMIRGDRGTEELGGPLRIADMSGKVAATGIANFIWLIGALSVNLALFNLLPVPMLDGGHLLFYAFEAMRGRPLGERVQEFGFRIGLAMVLTLMVFATWNDLVQLRVFDFISRLFT
ncbi:RIP metalloprotease RseP [Zavarzinia compransoris]|uniref:RIP metalloprotease RseP n=1 Tax=Zavarzinia marina TaxID=2911065 RepID=UPI001F27DF10|nr:RIP metalloprotease RseP [Zavarzinia marina]MCF4164599.1 RIP metalloprotease RseP [Zavarzinia marina]